MSRDRIVFNIALGIPIDQMRGGDLDTTLRAIDTCLTRSLGGVMRFSGDGTWAAGAQASDYSGPIERNNVVNYTISVMPCLEEQAFSAIRTTIAELSFEHGLRVEYVHVTRTEAEERIFRISDYVSPRAADEETIL